MAARGPRSFSLQRPLRGAPSWVVLTVGLIAVASLSRMGPKWAGWAPSGPPRHLGPFTFGWTGAEWEAFEPTEGWNRSRYERVVQVHLNDQLTNNDVIPPVRWLGFVAPWQRRFVEVSVAYELFPFRSPPPDISTKEFDGVFRGRVADAMAAGGHDSFHVRAARTGKVETTLSGPGIRYDAMHVVRWIGILMTAAAIFRMCVPTRQEKEKQDILCDRCGYSLVGSLQTGRCPECGEPI